MFKKPFTAAALIILGLVAVLHVVRLSLGGASRSMASTFPCG